MRRCLAFALLHLAVLAANAQAHAQPVFCDEVNTDMLDAPPRLGQPPSASNEWTWVDRDCKTHSLDDLKKVLNNHKKWLERYDSVDRNGTFPKDADSDPLRADLAGAKLTGAGAVLSHARLSGANLVGTGLSGADLTGANLRFADLTRAGLEDTDLSQADLYGADLTGADLKGAYLEGSQMAVKLNGVNLSNAKLDHIYVGGADLTEADLTEADLTGADLRGADLTDARLDSAYLTGAKLGGARLNDAKFLRADLTGANLEGVDFTRAQLTDADLSESNLKGADLSDIDLTGANLWNQIFEPAVLPPPNSIARAKGLRTLRWSTAGDMLTPVLEEFFTPARDGNLYFVLDDNLKAELRFTQAPTMAFLVSRLKTQWNSWRQSKPKNKLVIRDSDDYLQIIAKLRESWIQNPYCLIDLRHALHDAGYVEAEAEVNLAYHRRVELIAVENWWQIPFFDWTCEWGANWSRPIKIVTWLGLFCSFLYWYLIRFTRHNYLFVVSSKGKREQQRRVGRNYAPLPWIYLPKPRMKQWRLRFPLLTAASIWVRLRWEFPLFWTAGLFSFMSVLNLGVQGLDIGRWVRLIQSREFDLKARGKIRAIAGVQSVLSFMLLLLAVVSYFGHPFE